MNRKTYLSRAQTRAMAFDHPIGDAFGGAAYGEKNDPVSAGFAIYSMYGAYAATAITVWQGVAAVGGALTLIGMATGNSKLTKLGQLGMVAGGIGQMAQSAMADPSALAEGGGSTTATTTSVADGNLAPVVDAGGPVEVLNAAPPPAPVDVGPATNLNTGPTVNPVDMNQVGGPTTSLNNPLSPPPVPEGSVPVVDRGLASTPQVGPPAPPPPAGTGSTFMSDLAKNPMGMYAAASVVGQVGDYLSGKTDAEIDAMKAQTGYNNAKALETQALLDKEKLRRANLNAGYTNVNTSMTVNPNAQIARPWDPRQAAAPATPVNPAGLIAGARKA